MSVARWSLVGSPAPSGGSAQLNSLYVQGPQQVPWYTKREDGSEQRTMFRHEANSRKNSVARQRYVQNILADGLMAEMRAPRCPPPVFCTCGGHARR
jgi:hypothetical protein